MIRSVVVLMLSLLNHFGKEDLEEIAPRPGF
jgi:hypothetical protein